MRKPTPHNKTLFEQFKRVMSLCPLPFQMFILRIYFTIMYLKSLNFLIHYILKLVYREIFNRQSNKSINQFNYVKSNGNIHEIPRIIGTVKYPAGVYKHWKSYQENQHALLICQCTLHNHMLTYNFANQTKSKLEFREFLHSTVHI